jgi:dsDNA-specific endonuclease/ATPase MutS2
VRVLHEASTYLLCELSLDEFAFAALAERDRVAAYVATVEESVRARLTAAVRAAAEAVHRSCGELGALDDFLARVAFAQRFAAVVPEIVDEALLAFEDARYLPLAEALQAHGLAYEPISLELRGAAVLSGPNMGGKTAALRACGFLAACVAFGLPVPAKSARIPLFDEIAWLGIGADAPGGGLLSAFGAEVVDVRDCLERAATRPLVLVDELARTTSPAEGRALLIALLENLASHGAVALAATHYADVAEAAHVAHYAIAGLHGTFAPSGRRLTLDDALRHIAQAMDYRIRRVDAETPARSDAFALAEALGLQPDVLARAREAL